MALRQIGVRVRIAMATSGSRSRCVLSITSALHARSKTDVVTLANRDHITGEVKRLERGRLTLSTDDGGTIYFEWDNVAHVESVNQFEVATTDDRRFFGSLGPAPDGFLAVVGPAGIGSLAMTEVTAITPMGTSFWSKLDGSFDAGFSYTRSSGVGQLNLNSETVFRRPRFTGRLTASVTATKQQEGGRDDRGSLEASYVRHRWPRWFVSATGRFESNESLGLRLRSQIGAAVGPRLVNSNRAQMFVGGGLALNDERGVDSEATQNLEAVVLLGTSYFTYDQPRTNVDVSFQVLSEPQRYRPASAAARCRLQARSLEGFLRCPERVRHLRQPAPDRRCRDERRGHGALGRLELLKQALPRGRTGFRSRSIGPGYASPRGFRPVETARNPATSDGTRHALSVIPVCVWRRVCSGLNPHE